MRRGCLGKPEERGFVHEGMQGTRQAHLPEDRAQAIFTLFSVLSAAAIISKKMVSGKAWQHMHLILASGGRGRESSVSSRPTYLVNSRTASST